MKIAYLIGDNLDCHPGLKQKINGQIERWQRSGHEVFVVNHGTWATQNPKYHLKKKAFIGVQLFEKIAFFRQLSRQYEYAFEEVKHIQPDLIYTRYPFPVPSARKLLKFPNATVIEINSDDRTEYLNKGNLSGLYNLLMRQLSLRCAKGFVFVTDELSKSNGFDPQYVPRLVLANGIDAGGVMFHARTNSTTPNIVFVGSPNQSWHGLDKIKHMAERLCFANFHIVGPSVAECEAVLGKGLNNIVSHGYLSKRDVETLLGKMDFGIGTLALHRNNMEEACPLKVRQYLAHGIPVLAAYQDTDINDSMPFFLRIGNHEGNVEESLGEIAEFIEFGFQNEELRSSAREFAERVLSNEAKELKRLQFFEALLSR